MVVISFVPKSSSAELCRKAQKVVDSFRFRLDPYDKDGLMALEEELYLRSENLNRDAKELLILTPSRPENIGLKHR